MSKKDNWIHKSEGMLCKTCMYFVAKAKVEEGPRVGRCRKHAPTLEGWPVMFVTDWCGDHKLDSDKLMAYKSNMDLYNDFMKDNPGVS